MANVPQTPFQVNKRGDEVAQLASDYNPAEIAFFKGVVSSEAEFKNLVDASTGGANHASAELLVFSFIASCTQGTKCLEILDDKGTGRNCSWEFRRSGMAGEEQVRPIVFFAAMS